MLRVREEVAVVTKPNTSCEGGGKHRVLDGLLKARERFLKSERRQSNACKSGNFPD